MLEEKKKRETLDNNFLLNKRKDEKKRTVFMTYKNRLFLLGVLVSVLVIGAIYFSSNISRIFHINVKGNVYLTDDDVIAISGLNEDSHYLLTSSFNVEKKLKDSPFIKDAKLYKNDHRVITLEIAENKIIGYGHLSEDTVLFLEDGETIKLNSENIHLIQKVPLIQGFSAEETSLIVRGFNELDTTTINEISEIHRFPFSYDENMMELIMRDGNYIFVSSFGIKLLKNYYTIISGLDLVGNNSCIYLDEVTNSGYISSCPWEEVDIIIDDDNIDSDVID